MNEILTDEFLQQYFQPALNIKVEYNDNNGRVYCYCAMVHSYQPNCLTISLDSNEYIDLLAIGKNIFLVTDINQDNDVTYFQTVIQELLPGHHPVLKLSRPVITDIHSLRNFFRCDIDLPFRYIDKAVLEFSGEIINLSASGLLGVISYDSTLKINKFIEVQFNLPFQPKALRLPAEIVRIINLPESRQEIAVHFTGISEICQSQIIKYLFFCQRMSRHSQNPSQQCNA